MKNYFKKPFLTYTEDAVEISKRVGQVLSDIVQEERTKHGDDVNLRELGIIFQETAAGIIVENILRRSVSIKKENKGDSHAE